MKKFALFLLATFTISSLRAQNLFPRKFNNCITAAFCLDCGDVKASLDDQKLRDMVTHLQSTNKLKGIKGKIMFQVLVDSAGKGCVLSHSDPGDHPISKSITSALNAFDGYLPAQTKGNAEPRTSINMSFEISDGTITAKIERIDMEAFKRGFDHPVKPEIFNKDYVYKNEHLKSYQFTVWNKGNSNLPNNMTDHLTIDKQGTVWLTVDGGLVRFDGSKFVEAGQNITDKGKYFGYYALATDNNNVKWVSAGENLYSYNDKEWQLYDRQVTGVGLALHIVNNPGTGEVFFSSDSGLVVYKEGKWSKIDKRQFPELPSDRIMYAKRDSKGRLWIGTFSGSAMIDESGAMTSFEAGSTPLKGKCITSMDEDPDGNVYFSIYEFNRKDKKTVNNDEGIIIWHKDGSVKQLTTSNSGMPFNHANCVLYDKSEKLLWISSDRAGLVRYDLMDGWENYHSDNSEIPTSTIMTMAFDNNGVLYLATRQGLVRMEKKQ
jgi:ligand-binding sensor domain-containing protein